MERGDELIVEAAEARITLIHPPAYDFYRLLRSKLHWGRGGHERPSRASRRAVTAMLTHLKLRDLVIVDEAELELGPGLLALTGETGAGKSIVVDASMLIAGGRGAGDIVRHGAERAEVAAGFSRTLAGAPAPGSMRNRSSTTASSSCAA